MQRPQAPENPWSLLSSFPRWRGLRDALLDLLHLLQTVGGDASDLADSVTALLSDPLSARAALPPNYALRLPLQKRQLTEQIDLENDLPTWLGELARVVCDVPVLLATSEAADSLGPALTAELPRTLQVRFADLVQQLRQMLQGRRRKSVPHGEGDALPLLTATRGLRFAAIQPDGFAVVLPREADAGVVQLSWYEVTLLLLREHGPDLARLHLRLQASWRDGCSHSSAQEALGLRRADPRRAYVVLRRLQSLRLSHYSWELDQELLSLEHRAQDLWSIRLQEGGQARLLEEGGTLVARGMDWQATPRPDSWIATLSSDRVNADLAHSLLVERDGKQNPLSLAIGLCLAAGVTHVSNREILRLAQICPTSSQPALWARFRAAVRLQERAGWVGDLSGWRKRERDWDAFFAASLRWESSGGTDQSVSALCETSHNKRERGVKL